MTLKCNKILEILKVHVRAKFHEVKRSVIRVRRDKRSAENNTAVTSASSNKVHRMH